MSPSSSFVFLSSILLLLFLAYSPTALTSVHAAAGEVGYFVLIDAGSTGSRAHVHQYVKDPTKKLPVVDESTNKKIKPGLSYYAEKDPPAVRKSIKELLDFIKETVPQKYWAQTPIHVQVSLEGWELRVNGIMEKLSIVEMPTVVCAVLYHLSY